MPFSLFKRTQLSERQERALDKTLASIRAQRRSRFRLLACVDGTEEGYTTVRMAARLAPSNDCDIIILHVRPIDHGLWSGGLQVRLARQNMLDAGIELPSLRILRESLEILKDEGIDVAEWEKTAAHVDAWGDPLGDNKVEYKAADGRSVVLKMKTAPDAAAGILDQYELGPYNAIIVGEPSHWRGEFKSFFNSGPVQQVTVVAPCSVLVTRPASIDRKGFFICTDGTSRSMQAVRRASVLAHEAGHPITLFSVASTEAGLPAAEENVKNARALLKAIGIKVAHIQTAVGEPSKEIASQGSEHMLIVVTDEGRTRFQRLMRGSTAYEVVRRAKTSVLDVR